MNHNVKRSLTLAAALLALQTGGTMMETTYGWIASIAAPTAEAAKVKADKDGYVPKVEAVQPQEKVDLAKLAVPDVSAADPKATPKTQALLKYLGAVAGSDQILYGHQNDMHRKVGKQLPSDSDTYDITGDYPAIVGMDGLALTGNELELTDEERAAGLTLPKKLAQVAIKADKEGAIVSMSCHMPNFAEVAQRARERLCEAECGLHDAGMSCSV
ncbi:glycosyl hydrolase [Selenomonas sp.]|uniref:glycosyl hydrolase n=1 Tax=Selenomonas sp. TaxID=2053611 RepID=UPI0025D932D6|nr:glycosyl hydrolase [Selenomonas sp.]MCI6284885.1 glycoside hydrolase family 26 protein [Selenomonas sp.]